MQLICQQHRRQGQSRKAHATPWQKFLSPAASAIICVMAQGVVCRSGDGSEGWNRKVGMFCGEDLQTNARPCHHTTKPPDPLHNANGQMEEVGCVYTCTCECVKGQYSKHKKDSTCQHIPQVSSLYSQDPTRHLSLSQVLVQYACREVNGQSLLLNMQSRHHSM